MMRAFWYSQPNALRKHLRCTRYLERLGQVQGPCCWGTVQPPEQAQKKKIWVGKVLRMGMFIPKR